MPGRLIPPLSTPPKPRLKQLSNIFGQHHLLLAKTLVYE